MNEIELIIDLHKDAERQGPGSEEDTLTALKLLNLQMDRPVQIADIGCGTGGQTMTLAKNLNAHITAIDVLPGFLRKLNEKARQYELADKIATVEASMDDLPFRNAEFDIIWSEGAIYNIGFAAGLKKWKHLLKKGGYLAVSEITWTTQQRPVEIEEFWKKEYPEIDTASNKISLLEANGYTLIGFFYLGQDSWIQHYYQPLEASLESFLQRHDHSHLANKVVNETKAEIELYNRFKEFYSYGFYIARRD
jgi:ubiquinone/menaquinone biosynthesis C-methylase UbiE